MTRLAVIGRGLFGSAAARHLARAGHDVTLIGPEEPAEFASHDGVFASHYDEGRITRRLATDATWSALATASVARYGEIEAASGTRFFTQAGALMVGPAQGAFAAATAAVRERLAIPADRLDDAGLAARFPFLAPGTGMTGWHEPELGHVSPRRLVAAQVAAARRAGARIVPAVANAIEGGTVRTDAGAFTFDHVLLATGGYGNALLPVPLALTVYARTVAFARVSEEEAARLSAMPAIVWRTEEGHDPYVLPPIRYPDGRFYLKIGGDPADRVLAPDEIGDWFRSGGDPAAAEHQIALLRRLVPGLAVEAVHHRPCITTFTAHGRPYIDRVDDRLAVCLGGCGAGAKSSDEIGRLGAEALLGRCDPRFTTMPATDNVAADNAAGGRVAA